MANKKTKLSPRLVRNFEQIQELQKCQTDSEIRRILQNSSPDFIACLVECICNVLSGQISIKRGQKTKLSKFKDHYRIIAQQRNQIKAKKVLNQKGCGIFLPLILSPLISVAASAIANELTK